MNSPSVKVSFEDWSPFGTATEDYLSLYTGVAQIPTPPLSDNSPIPEQEPPASVSVSTAFFPGANLDSQPPDLVVVSSDLVFFYVHRYQLLIASCNGFGNLLPCLSSNDGDREPVLLHHDSSVINIVLHTVYEMPFAQYTPTTQALMDAVDALKYYGMSLEKYVSPSTPLHQLLIFHAPLNPIEMYTLAASHGLNELATAVSSHSLSYSLSSLSDDMAMRMGPIYLKRLFFLHLGRVEALKRLLLPPPHPHTPTTSCNFEEQRRLTRVWALAAAYLAWDGKPDMPVSTIKVALQPLASELTCPTCKRTLEDRIKNMIAQWSVVKRTI